MLLKSLTSISVLLVLSNVVSCQWPTFHLYTKSKPNSYVQVTATNLATSGFSNSKQTKFLIHGFTDAGLRTNLLLVKDEILKKEDANIIVVDWEKGAVAPNYFGAVVNAKTTGLKVAEFISAAGINTANIHCIGHSLGAHACGFAGKMGKLKRISGLDPAGPLFKGQPAANRLDKTDADFVDNIHTDILLGIQENIGHKDFYPNSGLTQPGCSLSKDSETIQIKISEKADVVTTLSCSHSRVVVLYAESVNSACQFKSALCTGWDQFANGSCTCVAPSCSNMGYGSTSNQTEGKFYLATSGASPFCQ